MELNFRMITRNAGSEEMDLVAEFPDGMIAVECKASSAPQLTDGFWKAVATLQPGHSYVVAPIKGRYSVRNDVEVTGLPELLADLRRFL